MSLISRSDRTPRRVLALADDLSGAAETAAALRLPGRILLRPAHDARPAFGEAVVLDLDSRRLPPRAAAYAVRSAVCAGGDGVVLFKKADSLLRGNVAAETAAYAASAEGVVIAPAVPALGRTVRDGVVHLRGVPLHATEAWRAEPRTAPGSIAGALGDLPTAPVPLSDVRGALTDRLRELLARGRHPVCDAETDADLDAITRAALELGPDVRLLGAGGLAAALGRWAGRVDAFSDCCGVMADRSTLRSGRIRSAMAAQRSRSAVGAEADRWGADGGADRPPAGAAVEPPCGCAAVHQPSGRPVADRPVLVVVGTAEPTAAAQIAQLVAFGAHHIPLPARHLTRRCPVPADTLAQLLLVLERPGVTVVSIASGTPVDPAAAGSLVAGLARTVAEVAYDTDLVLTGGETARRVLDALGVTRLEPVGQIHHGAVHSRTPDGRSVVTRPGSHGETDSLLRITRALRPDPERVPAHVPAPVPLVPSIPGGEAL
ncbi:four-carbon acid sugar kinase family protein [Streptomyces cavernae]|uniref:four-carbon acid sugar kinase family protein n=1 Tax=Streptomyces cavernae TaxID=2259034 RepID=UPI001EE420BA|nr:four-carbon acid sugar kinase family protein [Streptomyces cavernae]